MTREIKFRAWNARDKKMYSPNWMGNGFWAAVSFRGELVKIDKHGHLVTLWGHPGDDNKRVNKRDLHLMQYTGLKDKNGVDIYHKDIFGNLRELRAVVEQEEDGRWIVKFLDNRIPSVSITHGLVTDSEVVGNIYENPELLEGKV